MYPLPGNGQAGIYIFPQIFRPIGQNATFPGVSRVFLAFHFYNLRDQLLPSMYPWLRNRCLAINTSSLLVSADLVTNPEPTSYLSSYQITCDNIFSSLGQMCYIYMIKQSKHTHTKLEKKMLLLHFARSKLVSLFPL
jgi:hypothetical protein